MVREQFGRARVGEDRRHGRSVWRDAQVSVHRRERGLSLFLCSSVCGALEVLTLYGPFLFRFFYADPIRLVTELDGTRIIGAEVSEFLQIVPGALFPSFAR